MTLLTSLHRPEQSHSCQHSPCQPAHLSTGKHFYSITACRELQVRLPVLGIEWPHVSFILSCSCSSWVCVFLRKRCGLLAPACMAVIVHTFLHSVHRKYRGSPSRPLSNWGVGRQGLLYPALLSGATRLFVRGTGALRGPSSVGPASPLLYKSTPSSSPHQTFFLISLCCFAYWSLSVG